MAPFEWKILYNLGIIHLTMQQYPYSFSNPSVLVYISVAGLDATSSPGSLFFFTLGTRLGWMGYCISEVGDRETGSQGKGGGKTTGGGKREAGNGEK